MTSPTDVKQQVRQFYDQVGWQEVSAGTYQNAHYEDLRPVAREYIQHCHQRVSRHIKAQGRLLLDAGSGPIQYPEYLAYSQGYQRRVCADISIQALQEARKRIGEHGLFVVTDIANLPFAGDVFEGVVSLHTIHHLPEEEHLRAYEELYRVLASGESAVVVNGWPESRLMKRLELLVRLGMRLRNLSARLAGKAPPQPKRAKDPASREATPAKGTFINRHGVEWMKGEVGSRMPVEILVWRSASVRFTRSLIHTWLGGRYWLRLLYRLEERYPHWFGENGQYPLIVIRKDEQNMSFRTQ
jgi:SAM-dependent methyltransferase